MNEIEMALLRHEKRKNNKETTKENKNFISTYFTKVLLSIIFILISTIYIKLSPDNLEYYKKHIFESNLTFTKINNWYHKTFGNILPTVTEPKETQVSNSKVLTQKESYLDGYKISANKNQPVSSMMGGILVYMGEKEGYQNTFIIQGMDGVDIWYGGIIDSNLKLYDYVDAGTIIGNTENDFYYLVFMSNGAYLKYEDYLNQVSS